MIRKILLGMMLAGLVGCQTSDAQTDTVKTEKLQQDKAFNTQQVTNEPKSRIALFKEDPQSFYEARLQETYASEDLKNYYGFNFVLTRESDQEDIWTLESFHAPYHANPEFIYDSQLPISADLLAQFLEMLNQEAAITATGRNDKHITALSFRNSDFVREYVRFNRQKTRANLKVPVFKWNLYVQDSLEFVDGYVDHKDMATTCGHQSTYKLMTVPAGQWGEKFMNGHTKAKFFGCPIAWDGDLTQFQITYMQLVGFE